MAMVHGRHSLSRCFFSFLFLYLPLGLLCPVLCFLPILFSSLNHPPIQSLVSLSTSLFFSSWHNYENFQAAYFFFYCHFPFRLPLSSTEFESPFMAIWPQSHQQMGKRKKANP